MQMKDDDLGVKGGQGRTGREVADLTWFWVILALVGLVSLLMLAGCIKPPPGKLPFHSL
jgi:hypothetical protein